MNFKLFFLVILGTVLEYFDFLLFAHFGFILTPLFFPETNPIISALIALGLFAVGFLMRPLGGFFFGSIGDRSGRKATLSLSVLCIVLPTFCIACMPTYEQIGPFASVALLICRMMQGLSLGGEYTNAGVFLMEHAGRNNRGLYSSILAAAGSVGSLIGLACVFIIMKLGITSWGWRIPFLIGAGMGLWGYRLRRLIQESPTFYLFKKRYGSSQLTNNVNIWKQILFERRAFLITLGIGALVGVLVWIPVTYTNFYLTKIKGMPYEDAVPYTCLASVTYITSLLFMGSLGTDGMRKKLWPCPHWGLWFLLIPYFGV